MRFEPVEKKRLQSDDTTSYAKILHILDQNVPVVDPKAAKVVKRFKLIDGVLYQELLREGTVHDLFWVPKLLRFEDRQSCHDDRLAGHFGFRRTWDLVKKSSFGPCLHLRKAVR